MKPTRVAALLIAFSVVACSVQVDTGENEDFTKLQSGMYAFPSEYWTGAPPMIPVCFEPGSMSSEFSSPRAWLIDEMMRSVQRFARVNFVFQPTACTSNQAGIHVFFSSTEAGGFGQANGIHVSGINNGVRISDCGHAPGSSNFPHGFLISAWGIAKAREQCIRKVGLHELGHSLGFRHPEDSPQMQGIILFDANNQTCNNPSINGGSHYGGYNRMSFMSSCGGLAASEIGYWDSEIEPSDIAAMQRAYGRRIPGTLLASSGRCAASIANAPGDASFLWDCDEYADDQEWVYNIANRTLRVESTNLCLHTVSGQTKVQSCPTTPSTSYQWTHSNTYIRGWGGLCLDLNGGNTNNGNVQAWTCGALSGANQKWTLSTSGEIKFANTNACLTATSTVGPMKVNTCTGSNLQKFDFTSVPGHIKVVGLSNTCVDIAAPFDWDYIDGADYAQGTDIPFSGASVNTYPCTPTQFNQKFNFSGPIVHAGSGKCLTRASTSNGSLMTVEVCSGSDNQIWDYYAK